MRNLRARPFDAKAYGIDIKCPIIIDARIIIAERVLGPAEFIIEDIF
jgi:hypothetical protein